MTKELKDIIKKIDVAFTLYFKNNENVETIFVVGSMAKDDYQDRFANDYDIRVISSKVTKEDVKEFNYFLEELSKTLTTDEIEVSYSTLVGPVNHKVSTTKKNILIHAMIHEKSQMTDFLPETHKYQYGKRYRIVYGIDNLEKFKDVRYTLDDILNGHEGLNFCIDMLKRREYRYLDWDIDNDIKFNYHAIPMKEDVIYENCFYSVNKFIDNLMNYCNFEGYVIPNHKMDFVLQLLGNDNIQSPMLFLLDGLLRKDEILLKNIFNDIIEETINLLKMFGKRVNLLEELFERKKKDKSRRLVKS